MILSDILKANPGGYLSNKQYTIDVSGSSYPEQFSFDRFYWNHKLLVDFINEPHLEIQKESVRDTVGRKRKIAEDNGMTYLPIIGSITRDEIRIALGA
jgi:hypothetical protein